MKINFVTADDIYLTDDEIPYEKEISIASSYIFKDDAGNIEMYCKLSLVYSEIKKQHE